MLMLAAALVLNAPASARPLEGGGSAPPDAAGDSGVAPDITTITLANDNAGKLSWRIGLPNRAQFVAPDFVSIFVDADSRDTGDDGFEFLIQADGRLGPALFSWGGPGWVEAQSKTITASFTGGVLEVSIDFREFGSELIVFWVYADTAPASADEQFDEAPNAGKYAYFVQVPLLFKSLKKPTRVTAGRAATISLDAWTDNQQRARVSCTARAGSRRIKGRALATSTTIAVPDSGGGGLVATAYLATTRCTFVVPRGARGRTLTARITVTKGGVSITRALTTKVR
jgi:hypothetical protein